MELFVQWLVAWIGKLGYPGIVVLMTLESSFFPVPSELVIPPAGYLISQGSMDGGLIVLAGTAGSLLGALFNYGLACFLGRPLLQRYGRYFLLPPHRFEQVDAFFKRHGEISTFSGRFIPVVRHIISFPAGLARMNLKRFCLYTALGSSLWVTILTWIGYLVGNNMDLVRKYSQHATIIVILGLMLMIAVYCAYHRRSAKLKKQSHELTI